MQPCQVDTNVCRKTCLVGLLIRSILRGKNWTSAVFPAQNRKNQQTNKTCFALIRHLLSIPATTSWKMLMNFEFKADTSTGKPTGISRCHTLASRALNMSCSFGQSARSIESRCAAIPTISTIYIFFQFFFIVDHLKFMQTTQPANLVVRWATQKFLLLQKMQHW